MVGNQKPPVLESYNVHLLIIELRLSAAVGPHSPLSIMINAEMT